MRCSRQFFSIPADVASQRGLIQVSGMKAERLAITALIAVVVAACADMSNPAVKRAAQVSSHQ